MRKHTTHISTVNLIVLPSALPDISKWNINSVTNMSGMFSHCSNLSALPDISKWNINNVTNMSGMFSHCSNLSVLPNISKWNINNVTNMSGMIDGCDNLKNITYKFREYNKTIII